MIILIVAEITSFSWKAEPLWISFNNWIKNIVFSLTSFASYNYLFRIETLLRRFKELLFEGMLLNFLKWNTHSTEKYLPLYCVKSVQIRSFFWSVFFCIRTEYEDLLRKSPYSVRIQENTDHKKLRIWILFTQCFTLWHMPAPKTFGGLPR